ncbi:MAG: lipopolysaccharide biosynthesis protein [Prevotella sp.]|nr:lipopolysaccharide biosynthesis protein [Prevotella sp.]
MASLKSLVKDTAIYGMSSILGRFLNYLLVPLQTHVLPASDGGYGVITNIYAYVALGLVILTYGMETTFFRFMNKEGENPQNVYKTILTMVGTTSTVFVLLVLLFLNPISAWMGYSEHPSYIWTMAIVVALDAFQSIPFAYLRYQKRPIKFATLKVLSIFFNIVLNIICFLIIYDPAIGPGYAFYINLACTAFITLFFWKELRDAMSGKFDKSLVKPLLHYSWPILVLGIAGILNQAADKMIFPYIYPSSDAQGQLGIYGAATKIAMIMAMITQAFRYAYEPFVFAGSKEKGQKDMYAKAMKYFILFTLLAFLMVVGYIDILKFIINKDYWEGLKVVPIVMTAEIMMGVAFNLSFWYKLTDKTIWGAIISGTGCLVLIAVNIIFVPKYSYMACAWGGVAGYATCMIFSYFMGQKYYPIDYNLKTIALYVAFTALGYYAMTFIGANFSLIPKLLLNTIIIIAFAAACIKQIRKSPC